MTSSPRRDDVLRGRTSIITGAGRGIGRGGAVGLARRGARVAIFDVVPEELDVTLGLVRAEGAEAMGIIADLRRRDEIDRALQQVTDAWGPPDVLINNAAVLHLRPFEETDPAVWDETVDVNLHTAYYLTWRVYRGMLDRGHGNIVTMSSTAGVKPFARETAYCATKYALEGLLRSLSLEAAPRGIIVTLCTPGATTKPTSMTDAAFAALPADRQTQYVSPQIFAEAFGYLAATRDPELSGRRFDLFALAELVREQGWAAPARLALQRAERNAA
ncbi:MAG: SDR family NAD(P)-dependent oxidoreductase [Armatimonadota bacterium]